MLINDLIAMLEDLPRTLAARLGDVVLRRACCCRCGSAAKAAASSCIGSDATRQKSGVAPAVGRRARRRAPVKSVPMSSGDAFGELEALLEPPDRLASHAR